jgi:hypothetical protein
MPCGCPATAGHREQAFGRGRDLLAGVASKPTFTTSPRLSSRFVGKRQGRAVHCRPARPAARAGALGACPARSVRPGTRRSELIAVAGCLCRSQRLRSARDGRRASPEGAGRRGGRGREAGADRLAPIAARRRASGAIAFALRRSRRFDDPALEESSAAVTRWRIASLPSPRPLPAAPDTPGLARARWRLDLVRARGAEPGSWIVEACDATGRLALAADLADRPAAPARRWLMRGTQTFSWSHVFMTGSALSFRRPADGLYPGMPLAPAQAPVLAEADPAGDAAALCRLAAPAPALRPVHRPQIAERGMD